MTATADWMTPEHHFPAARPPDGDQLAYVLRSLAARLEEIDGYLSDVAGRLREMASGPGAGDRTTLEVTRAWITSRLGSLAAQLADMNGPTTDARDDRVWSPHQVGTCPGCGYPSLASGLCAFCQPMEAC